MRSVAEVTSAAGTRYRRTWTRWAVSLDDARWPLALSLDPPSAREIESDVAAVDTWIREWTSMCARHPGTALRSRTVTTRVGRQAVPSHLEIGSPEALADLLGRGQEWRGGRAWADAVDAFAPTGGLTPSLLATVSAVDAQEIPQVLAVASWLREHPRSGLLPRAIPVEGIDTKWITGRYRVLAALLRQETGDQDEAVDDAHDDPRLTALGLRPRPHYVRLRVLDPALRDSVAGVRDLAVVAEELARLPWSPAHLLIVENLETAVALPDLPGTVVMHSLGHAIDPLRDLAWARAAHRVTYWGDLDAEGLTILSRVRGLGYPARSVLMDASTLDTFRHLAVSERNRPRFAEAPHLTADEREAYEGLRAGRWGRHLRLEQERIPLAAGLAALAALD